MGNLRQEIRRTEKLLRSIPSYPFAGRRGVAQDTIGPQPEGPVVGELRYRAKQLLAGLQRLGGGADGVRHLVDGANDLGRLADAVADLLGNRLPLVADPILAQVADDIAHRGRQAPVDQHAQGEEQDDEREGEDGRLGKDPAHHDLLQ